MNIRPSAAIRQNYNEIAELCRSTTEPVFLTKTVKVILSLWILRLTISGRR